MTARIGRLGWIVAIGLPLLCVLPPVAAIFESSMRVHMLLQLPMLALCGVVLAHYSPLADFARSLDPGGYSAAVLFSGWLVFWMLPINLDAAQASWDFRLLKLISIPLGVGVCGVWGWRRMGGVGRGVVVLEAWAMLVRTGWIFLVSPQRVCSGYLLDEQRVVAHVLLYISLALAVIVFAWAMFRPSTSQLHQQRQV